MISKLETVGVNAEILPVSHFEENQSAPQNKTNQKSGSENEPINFKKCGIKKKLIYRFIGAKIAYYRTLRQLSQRELASKINLSTSALGRIERGKYNNGVPLSTLLDIAEGLKIEISALVTFSEEEKKLWLEIDKNIL